jgi:thiol-disulfide isomerase/thioredoxin
MHRRTLFSLALLVATAQLSRPAHAAVPWFTGTAEAALAASALDGDPTLLYFTATWCPACRALDAELLATPEGRTATSEHRAVKVDVDAPGGDALVERFVILAYPSALVVGADGKELGRVVGFDGPGPWTTRLAQVTARADSLPRLRDVVRRQPEVAPPLLALARALLERGERREGEASLQLVSVRWPRSDAAAEALWCLGRYYHRVRRQPVVAQHIWRELGERFSGSSWANSAWSWYGKAQASLGRIDAGARALEAVARRDLSDATLLGIYAGFLNKHRATAHFQTAASLIDQALALSSGGLPKAERDALEVLAAQLK